jgi:hypothetical protein
MQGSASEASQADGSDSELNELSDASEDAMLDTWQEMGSIIGEADSMVDDAMRDQHNTEMLPDVNGLLEADILLPTFSLESNIEHEKARDQLKNESVGSAASSWTSSANLLLQGPAGEVELQQIIEKCDDTSQNEALLQSLHERLEKVKIWANNARHTSGKKLSEAQKLLDDGRALHADSRIVGRLAEQVAGAESLRSRIAEIIEADSSSADALADHGCDLRVCRALLQEAERVSFQIPEVQQLKIAVSRAEVCQLPLTFKRKLLGRQ